MIPKAPSPQPDKDQIGSPFNSKTSFLQIVYGAWVCLTSVSSGLAIGFSTVQLSQLGAGDAKIRTTVEEKSWIGSVLTLSSPLGCMFCGLLLDRLGRRAMMIICEIPMVIGWLFTGSAKSATDIIVGKIITGIGFGMALGPPRVYLTEITLPNMRGVVGIFANIALSIGFSAQASLGLLLNWKTLCYINGGYSVILMFSSWFLPETPYYVLMTRDDNAVLVTLKRFRSKTYDVNGEMFHLKKYKTANQIRSLSMKEKLKFTCTAFACRPFWIIMIYMTVAQLSGISVVMFYAIQMLQDAKSSIDPETGMLIIGLSRFLSAVFVSVILYKIAKRPLALLSSIGVGSICLILGTYVRQYESTSSTSEFPVIALSGYVFFGVFGYYTLPMLMMFEVFPLQIRGLLGGISISYLNLLMFACSRAYPYLRSEIGFSYTMILFGICSFLGAIFLYCYLPETQNLTLQQIEDSFRTDRPQPSEQPGRRTRSTNVDSESVPRNSTYGRRDTLVVRPDSMAGRRDTMGAPLDSMGFPRDVADRRASMRVPRDNVAASREGTAVPRESMAVPSDGTSNQRESKPVRHDSDDHIMIRNTDQDIDINVHSSLIAITTMAKLDELKKSTVVENESNHQDHDDEFKRKRSVSFNTSKSSLIANQTIEMEDTENRDVKKKEDKTKEDKTKEDKTKEDKRKEDKKKDQKK